MGMMDKAKDAALQAKEQAEHLLHEGQAKLAELQHARTEGDLYKKLGKAYYAEQRHGADHGAVATALAGLDAHHASSAPASESAGAGAAATPGAEAAPAAGAVPPSAVTPPPAAGPGAEPSAGDGPAATGG